MHHDFNLIRNHHERAVYEVIGRMADDFPHLANSDDLLCDVACVALNRLPPRYIRHEVDFSFYQSEKDRAETERAVDEAVRYAFGFVQARMAMRARA
jgi:hypothetical protein